MPDLLVVNPNTTSSMTEDIGACARSVASPGTTITAVNPEGGPRSIEGHADEAIAAYHIVDLVAAMADDYDGIVIACYGDPAVAACREVTEVPVVGIAEATFHMGSLLAYRWSVVTVLPRVIPLIEDTLHRVGLERRCASIRSAPLSVLQMEEDLDHAKRMVLAEARLAIEEDGAEAILLGCGGMGPLDRQMSEELGVPVLDGTSCAVKLVEGLVGYGQTTSKVNAYLDPEPKELVSCPGGLSSVYRAPTPSAR